MKIEVEARNLEEAKEAVRAPPRPLTVARTIGVESGKPSACVTFFIYTLQAAAGADVVMLDNYTPAALAIDAAALKVLFPHVLVEASGVSRSFI